MFNNFALSSLHELPQRPKFPHTLKFFLLRLTICQLIDFYLASCCGGWVPAVVWSRESIHRLILVKPDVHAKRFGGVRDVMVHFVLPLQRFE